MTVITEDGGAVVSFRRSDAGKEYVYCLNSGAQFKNDGRCFPGAGRGTYGSGGAHPPGASPLRPDYARQNFTAR